MVRAYGPWSPRCRLITRYRWSNQPVVEDLYGYDLNSATIEEALERGYTLAESVERQVIGHLLEQQTVHFDETGVRVAGRLHWLHAASTATHTHLFVHEKRGAAALAGDASVLKDFHGVAVHDCWLPYFHFEQARHVLCEVHLLRELNGLMENAGRWARGMHELLVALYHRPRPILAADEVRGHYHRLLAQADREEPPPHPGRRGKPKQSKGRNLLNRLREQEDGVLAFALEADIPFTNNPAERDLRPAKMKQEDECVHPPAAAIFTATCSQNMTRVGSYAGLIICPETY